MPLIHSRRAVAQSVDDIDLRYGGIGGLTEAIGLTDVQREENPDDKKFSILIKVVRRQAAVACNYCSAETPGQTLQTLTLPGGALASHSGAVIVVCRSV